jgi:5'-methylthioadenosine/S-adenosylhomocysteine nucleosidase
MILLLFAYDINIKDILLRLENKQDISVMGFPFYQGKIEGKNVIIGNAGAGKVLASIITQRIIDMFEPVAVIFNGTAGTLVEDLSIGDTLIVEDCIQHDINMTSLGYKRGEIPMSPYRIISCNSALVEIASQFRPESGKVQKGRTLSGDQFVTGRTLKALRYLYDELKGHVIDTEGAAVGLTCAVNKRPYLAIKIITDKVDENAIRDYQLLLPKIPKHYIEILNYILSRYPAAQENDKK